MSLFVRLLNPLRISVIILLIFCLSSSVWSPVRRFNFRTAAKGQALVDFLGYMRVLGLICIVFKYIFFCEGQMLSVAEVILGWHKWYGNGTLIGINEITVGWLRNWCGWLKSTDSKSRPLAQTLPDWFQNVQLKNWGFIEITITICALEQDIESQVITGETSLQVAWSSINVSSKWQVVVTHKQSFAKTRGFIVKRLITRTFYFIILLNFFCILFDIKDTVKVINLCLCISNKIIQMNETNSWITFVIRLF